MCGSSSHPSCADTNPSSPRAHPEPARLPSSPHSPSHAILPQLSLARHAPARHTTPFPPASLPALTPTDSAVTLSSTGSTHPPSRPVSSSAPPVLSAANRLSASSSSAHGPDRIEAVMSAGGSTPPETLSHPDIHLSDVSSHSCVTSPSVSSDHSDFPECKSSDDEPLFAPPASRADRAPHDYGSTGHSTVLSVDDLTEGRPACAELLSCARRRKLQADRAARDPADRSVHRVAERTRDWSFGPITGHRVIVLTSMILCTAFIYVVQDVLWPRHGPNRGLRALFADFSVLWLTIVPPSMLGLIGALLYRHNDRLDDVDDIEHVVFWRIVSRGTNRDALLSTIARVRKEMCATPLFPYVIEVVTDVCPDLPRSDDLVVITVPKLYQPPNLSRFKARALHYALDASVAPDNAWLVHLDEETQPTSSGVKGIASMIAEEERTGRLRIGQGALLYHRLWLSHPFLTLADNMRTGDDMARFYLQHWFGITIFGLHGSYIVCRNDVEKSVGFDFGPVGSITEDAFWALACMQNGSRSRWVDGYLEEQSTQSVVDFVKQRRRWLHGLFLVCFHAPVYFRFRVGLLISALIWAISPLATVYTATNLVVGASVNWVVRLLTNFSVAYYCTLYLVGAIANLDELGKHTRLQKFGWCVAQLALMGVFSLVEAFAVAYAFIRPETGFHVVTK